MAHPNTGNDTPDNSPAPSAPSPKPHHATGLTPAAGVEREIRALRAATEVAQAWADEHITGPIPAVVTIGHPAAHHAALIVMNALNWTRAVGERVDRMDFKEPAGLLPSLKDSALKTAIEALFKTLDDPTLQNARRFDNYVLHYGAIQGGTTPGYHLRADRSVYFAFPDAVTKGVGTWEVFEYNDERDALTHLEEVFDGIATFIDGMLDAFDAQPRPPGWPH